MKTIKIITLVLLFMSVLSCKSSEFITTNKAPFKIEKATYSNWIGGVKGVRGYKIELELDTAYKLDSIYFRNMKTILESKKNDAKTYTAIFTIKQIQKDLILHSDSKKEFGNQVPSIQKNIPSKLKNNEAVISFQTKKGIQYFKVENINKVESEKFP